MKERPILFSAPMVRALLAGTKTQMRRIVKARDLEWVDVHQGLREPDNAERCPHGQPGDRLWVQEAWRAELTWNTTKPSGIPDEAALWYEADDQQRNNGRGTKFKGKLRSSIHMPRAASRITLEITSVRVERLQDISEADAKAEGIFPHVRGGWHWLKHDSSNPNDWNQFGYKTAALAFQALWESINGPDSWDANPWVWVVEFKAIEAKP